MYRQYLKQAWQMMKQNRFFSTVYVMGSGLAIAMVMVVAVVYQIRTANVAPEVHRDRLCYMNGISYHPAEGGGINNAGFGAHFVDECILSLVTPEAVAILTDPFELERSQGESFLQLPGRDEVVKVALEAVNDRFWQVYRFRFLSGRPFDAADFRSGLSCVVLNETKARRLFGRTDVAGETLLMNEITYTVRGVIADVPAFMTDIYADMWMPYTALPHLMNESGDEMGRVIGDFSVRALLKDPADIAALKQEYQQAVKRYEATLGGGTLKVSAPISYRKMAIFSFFWKDDSTTYLILGFLLLLFLLVPALNLSGLNASRMQDRVAELGVRKAFGARNRGLFHQILVENLLLMLPAGVIGLAFSFLLVDVLRQALLGGAIRLKGVDISFSPEMLLNMWVFAVAFGVCLLFNLLSSIVPVWRAVRLNIVDALNSK